MTVLEKARCKAVHRCRDCHMDDCPERDNEAKYPPEKCCLPFYDDMSGKTVYLLWVSSGTTVQLRMICTKRQYAETEAEFLRKRYPALVVSIEAAPVDHPFGKQSIKQILGE